MVIYKNVNLHRSVTLCRNTDKSQGRTLQAASSPLFFLERFPAFLFHIAKRPQFVLAVTPIRLDFYKQLKEHALVKEFFNILACLHADFFDFASLMADDDTLLGISLDIDDGHNVD